MFHNMYDDKYWIKQILVWEKFRFDNIFGSFQKMMSSKLESSKIEVFKIQSRKKIEGFTIQKFRSLGNEVFKN